MSTEKLYTLIEAGETIKQIPPLLPEKGPVSTLRGARFCHFARGAGIVDTEEEKVSTWWLLVSPCRPLCLGSQFFATGHPAVSSGSGPPITGCIPNLVGLVVPRRLTT